MWTLLAGLARADEQLSCEQVTAMVAAGEPTAAIVSKLAPCAVTAETAECLLHVDGLSPQIMAAAKVAAGECADTATGEPAPYTRPELPERWRPDTGCAVGLSAGVGFGAGHFYARRMDAGAFFAITQALGLGIALAYDPTKSDPALLWGGVAAFGLSRMIDTSTAGFSALGYSD